MTALNNFKFINSIGEGAQGVVNLYQDIRLGRNVAIKSLHQNLVNNIVLRDRFVEEAKLLSQLNHPSIVILFDYVKDDSFHLIMEFLEGTPLDKYIEEESGPIHELRAINIFLRVLEGISYIHSKKVIHRDIKPSNILLKSDDTIKLLDFGIAKNHQDDPRLTQVGTGVGGTPMYMSPEHVKGKDIDEQSDIYCLGVTFWQMITGKAPYMGLSQYEIYNSIINEPLKEAQTVYKHVSKRISDVISKATAKDKSERFNSCESFIRALEDIKSYLIKEGTQEEVVKQKIDIKVLNVKDATLVINNKGFVGSELTHYVLPGESVNITVVKQNYLSINKEFICNADRIINITLKKKTNILAIILSAIFILILFTLTINKYL